MCLQRQLKLPSRLTASQHNQYQEYNDGFLSFIQDAVNSQITFTVDMAQSLK